MLQADGYYAMFAVQIGGPQCVVKALQQQRRLVVSGLPDAWSARGMFCRKADSLSLGSRGLVPQLYRLHALCCGPMDRGCFWKRVQMGGWIKVPGSRR